uniref:Protein A20 n=1 Tax=Hipposideros bat herpesvirus TaxID=3141919 RepID=A0AAU7E155_9VIRU
MGTRPVNLILFSVPPGPAFTDRASYTLGPEDAYALLCNDLRMLDDSIVVLTRLSDFIRRYSGFFLLVKWPLRYGLFIGNLDTLRMDGVHRVRFFVQELSSYDWVCLCGVLREVTTEPRRFPDLYVLMTSSGQMFGYMPSTDRLYVLSDDPESFTSYGARNVSEFYETTSDFFSEEEEMFDHEATPDLVAVSQCVTSEDVIRYVYGMTWVSFRNKMDSNVIVLGDRGWTGVEEAVPYGVLDDLDASGYVPIGKMTVCSRFIFIGRHVGDIYILMSGGFLFKMADSTIAFLRSRWGPMRYGKPRCYVLSSEHSEYIPVGSMVRFDCHCEYTLPGDEDLKDWFCGSNSYPATLLGSVLNSEIPCDGK